MSIELEWDKLDSSLSSSLIELLNRQLSGTSRPSFIGPVEVTSLEFGSAAPDVELVDLRDIYRDFLEDDDDDESQSNKDPVKVTETDDEEGFEWVSRRAARREEGLASSYHQQPRYSGRAGPVDMFSSVPTLPSHMDLWNPGLQSLVDFRSPYASPWPHTPLYRAASNPPQETKQENDDNQSDLDSLAPEPEKKQPDENPHPNLQLHFHITWHSNLRITLTTSLLINYPSPMFMSLPIKLSVTGLVFDGEIAVAYEGERKRVHLCILDELDPYGPAGSSDRPKRRPSQESTLSSLGGDAASTPPDPDDDPHGSGIPGLPPSRGGKPLPIGQRLLPSIFIESEIGQADKHVLKNVSRVERFIQDVIRKTIEEELVFPNFHTLVMGEQ